MLGWENPKKEVEPIAPNSEAEAQLKYTIGVPDYSSSSESYGKKQKLMPVEFIESSRGHKIDGTKRNQTGETFGDKQGKQTEENGQESSQQRTSS